MKKLLFEAVGHVAGMVVSENVSAQTNPENGKNYKLVPTVPPAVRAAAEAWYAEIEIAAAKDGVPIGPLTYYVKGGYFYAIIEFGDAGGNIGMRYTATGGITND